MGALHFNQKLKTKGSYVYDVPMEGGEYMEFKTVLRYGRGGGGGY